jgi:hypothetical protein
VVQKTLGAASKRSDGVMEIKSGILLQVLGRPRLGRTAEFVSVGSGVQLV